MYCMYLNHVCSKPLIKVKYGLGWTSGLVRGLLTVSLISKQIYTFWYVSTKQQCQILENTINFVCCYLSVYNDFEKYIRVRILIKVS